MENQLNITQEQLHEAENKIIEQLKIYREVALDDNKSKLELKEAANNVIRAMSAYISLQSDSRNELIVLGQVLGEYITGSSKKPPRRGN